MAGGAADFNPAGLAVPVEVGQVAQGGLEPVHQITVSAGAHTPRPGEGRKSSRPGVPRPRPAFTTPRRISRGRP